MAAFGRAAGGGRRAAGRRAVSVAATLSTMSRIYHGCLVDLSPSGARIRGAALPQAGQEAWLRVGGHKLFGSVRWSLDSECGVEFFEPLALVEVNRVLTAQGRS